MKTCNSVAIFGVVLYQFRNVSQRLWFLFGAKLWWDLEGNSSLSPKPEENFLDSVECVNILA